MEWLIELAKVLVAPVAGLLGAYMGVRLSAGREDARLDRQERVAATARLLDHKREAHVGLLSAVARYETAMESHRADPATPRSSDGDVYESLHPVLMFASAEAAAKARALCFVLPRSGEFWDTDRAIRLRDARYDYLDALRADLGITGQDLVRPTENAPQSAP